MQAMSLSRRTFLKNAAFSATALALAACAMPAAPAATEGGQAAPAGEAIEIIHFDRNIPQDIEFRKELIHRFSRQ